MSEVENTPRVCMLFVERKDLHVLRVLPSTHLVSGEYFPGTLDVLAILIHDAAGHFKVAESVHVTSEHPGARFRFTSS